ncbi:MAG: hypothetical protein DRR42_21620 [Gammaproteobacteria bacterium]|nr:MAG: hypothetical protein DRR42_21620 [Gammaproteobacteria bacterium]
MEMRATQGVSFPRSGHAGIYHIARLYFGSAFIYCDVNNTKYCGCGRVPCINPNRTFAKNHDFELLKHINSDKNEFSGSPILPTEHYFIQYRNPVPSIASNFNLHLKRWPFHNYRDAWQEFAFKQIRFWCLFVDKWVLNFPSNANLPLYCSYEALIANPQKRVREILTFLSPDPLDEDRVKTVMQKIPIVPRNSISEFKFNDPVFFKELEAIAFQRLKKLGLPLFDEEFK